MIQQFHFRVYTQRYFKKGTQIDVCTPTLIPATFTIVKWGKPKCPSTDE